jgi:hypothetical protein
MNLYYCFLIKQWEESNSEISLIEYLGLSKEEYKDLFSDD